ncbi:hypothetical protein GCM10023328_05700 [Modestobacter marinus]|uniref:DNA-directed RNA polymerase subunit RPC12/RpoP n=1 Tax=Modestobacter marinus TaxID=477641 RepID=A0A846LHF1_9ACTN|nr:hypothetical protein [Modestobacter marinus]NIH67007.1 DNA-directed RNA polymerase subunit RPC12/RpoP [Modestobacter marinus]GGL51182.1 hypothetical protein GCM10011589_04260 [Modestobacter marinus]
MPLHIECPDCGETDDLVGDRGVEGIGITCGTCGARFLRDRRLGCASCAGTDLVLRPQVLTQFSRGTQLSVVGWTETHCCTACDAEALLRSERANAPLPAEYRPRAVRPPSRT